jgi:hypothetical protein
MSLSRIRMASSCPADADLAGLPGVLGLPGAWFPREGDLVCSGEPAISIADLDRYTDRWPEIYAANGRVPELEADRDTKKVKMLSFLTARCLSLLTVYTVRPTIKRAPH